MHGLSIAGMAPEGRRLCSSFQPISEDEPSLISTVAPSKPPEGAVEVDSSGILIFFI